MLLFPDDIAAMRITPGGTVPIIISVNGSSELPISMTITSKTRGMVSVIEAATAKEP